MGSSADVVGCVPATDRTLGDILAVLGSVCYGISNVAEEGVVKERSPVEFLAMLGLFGSVISGVQMYVLSCWTASCV